jgi:hypothetical protein
MDANQKKNGGLPRKDVRIALGMMRRGDRQADIAAWFGVNQGVISVLTRTSESSALQAPVADKLPPKGAPGLKGRLLRASLDRALDLLTSKEAGAGVTEAVTIIQLAVARYDSDDVDLANRCPRIAGRITSL